MLHDPRREKILDVDSLESLIAWLAQQVSIRGADAVYKYTDTGQGPGPGCVLCQYYRAHGVPVRAMERNHRRPNVSERVPLPEHFNEVAMGGLYRTFGTHYRTFGDALAVARKLANE
jgi:hypothetical protein